MILINIHSKPLGSEWKLNFITYFIIFNLITVSFNENYIMKDSLNLTNTGKINPLRVLHKSSYISGSRARFPWRMSPAHVRAHYQLGSARVRPVITFSARPRTRLRDGNQLRNRYFYSISYFFF